jgi:hypothetical protein
MGVCTNGTCGIQCNAGYTLCNGACVDLSTSTSNCGACGNACPASAGSTCCHGACCRAAYGETCCNGTTCTDLLFDSNNCGACGNRCQSGFFCCGGACYEAGSGTCCAGTLCPAGSVCTGGTCCPPGTTYDGGICCPSGQTNCGGACTDLTSDINNCGACGYVCLGGVNSQPVCYYDFHTNTSYCTIVCDPGWDNCSLNQSNVNDCPDRIWNNSSNCGACGHSCELCYECIGTTCTFSLGACL